MEDAESKRLEAHVAKKALERSRREAKKVAHKKVVSRVMAKKFTSGMKVGAMTFLRDVGLFRDRFDQDVLEADCMPWLIEQTSKFVVEMESHSSYPTTMIGNYMHTAQETHKREVQAYSDRIKARRAAEQKAKEDKISDKLRRKAEKEAKRKAEEIARLREEIKEKYVEKVIPIEEILKQEITDVDGWSQDGKPVVTALGGFLGQLMIVVNTVAKYYPQLDRPIKTGRSRSNSRPKSNKSGSKSQNDKDDAVSAKSGAGKSAAGESEVPRQLLNPQVIQQFIYTYINEKLKTEKFTMSVDARYEKFINSLANPLQLNEMRTMKAENYENIRTLLTNFLGSPILRLIKENSEKLEIDPDVFDLVYEGFWDLYTFHAQLRDVSARKLQGWI